MNETFHRYPLWLNISMDLKLQLIYYLCSFVINRLLNMKLLIVWLWCNMAEVFEEYIIDEKKIDNEIRLKSGRKNENNN